MARTPRRSQRWVPQRSLAQSPRGHVKGSAFWQGIIEDDIHTGDIDADAVARGPYLHLVDGDSACGLDLTSDPATHTFLAADNSMCGGANVRFAGTWTRFNPRGEHSALPSRTRCGTTHRHGAEHSSRQVN